MSGLSDPRFIITLLIGMLFAFAYAQDPSDQAMKGALIAAFSAAYGFWLGSKDKEKATENTGKAFDAILAAQEAPAAAIPQRRATDAANHVAEAAIEARDEVVEEGGTGNERPFK
jgi:hypothetical protein